MNKLIANACLTHFADNFRGSIETMFPVGSLAHGEDPPSNEIKAIILPKFAMIETQLSMIAGLVGGGTKVNKLTEALSNQNLYQKKRKKKDWLIFWFPKENVFLHLWLLDDPCQIGGASIMLSGPGDFASALSTIALLKHFHFDSKYRLHLHELGGIPGKRTICKLGSECHQLSSGLTEAEIFTDLGLPVLEHKDRTVESLKEFEKEIYAY